MTFDPLGAPSRTGTTTMTVAGLNLELHMPLAPKSKYGRDGEEEDQGLPPRALQSVHSVDEFDRVAPDVWKRGGVSSSGYPVTSYFGGVREDHALWFNFNSLASHSHDVAVLISIRGANAVAVAPFKFQLEQYRMNCPTHGIPFGAERFCRECGYKWPGQNYLSTTATPGGSLWLDGFVQPDGVVRNFLITSDDTRDVARQLGIKDPPQAFGFAFYLSKQPKPRPSYSGRRGGDLSYGTPKGGGFLDGDDDCLESSGPEVYRGVPTLGGGGRSYEPTRGGATRGGGGTRSYGGPESARRSSTGPSLNVGAGARIKQRVYDDPKDIGYWSDSPAGVIYFNYVAETTYRDILEAGRPDLTQRREGPLAGMNVGHHPTYKG